MALMGAITTGAFDDEPDKASRPVRRSPRGIRARARRRERWCWKTSMPACRRGARIYAEVLAVAAGADGNHLPQPCMDGQVRVMRRALAESGVRPEQIDYVSAHATSTPAGDIGRGSRDQGGVRATCGAAQGQCDQVDARPHLLGGRRASS